MLRLQSIINKVTLTSKKTSVKYLYSLIYFQQAHVFFFWGNFCVFFTRLLARLFLLPKFACANIKPKVSN